MTILQLFYRYLKINNIYNLFFYNIQNRKYESSWQYNIEDIKTYKAYYLINHAFSWGDTKEGYGFWYYINAKWREIILFLSKKLSKYESFDSLLSNREIKLEQKKNKMKKVSQLHNTLKES